MSQLEDLVTQTLHDPRRRLATPPDTRTWVAARVRRQRQVRGALAGVASVALLAVAALVIVPIVSDSADSYYDAARPVRGGVLLPWTPVGGEATDTALVESAIETWRDSAADGSEPTGSVHVVMAEEWAGQAAVMLQGVTADGKAALALVADADASTEVALELAAVSGIGEPRTVEALVLPSNAVTPVPENADVVGWMQPGLILAPKWREPYLDAGDDNNVGWQRSGNRQKDWQHLTFDDSGWFAPLISGDASATVVIDSGDAGEGPVAPVVTVPSGDDGDLVAQPYGVRFVRPPGEARPTARPEALDGITAMWREVGGSGPVDAQVFAWGGSLGASYSRLPKGEGLMISRGIVQLTGQETDGSFLVTRGADQAGREICQASRPIATGRIAAAGLVVTACQHTNADGDMSMFAFSRLSSPGEPVYTGVTAAAVLPSGERVRWSLGNDTEWDSYGVVDDGGPAPVRYIFRAYETSEGSRGTLLDRWVWPGSSGSP